jgi:DNA polymerase-1
MGGVMLVDANNVAIRSVMAPKQDMSVGEVDTGSLVLFVNTLSRYTRMFRPDCGLVCWDSGRSSYRVKIFPPYKANRSQKVTDQAVQPIALMQTFLKLCRFPQLQLPGYEGDDLIAASWRACRGRERILILSSDKDMLQLVEDGTEQLKLVSNGTKPDRWDRTRFIKEMGYKPEYQAWVLALTGDTSDGIPGLAKVGPKTATKMLNKYDWDMSALVKSLSAEDQEKVLTNVALTDLALVPLELPPPPHIEPVGPGHPEWPRLAEFCDRWELTNIKHKLEDRTLWFN